jgi:histidinol-phosphatase (PHP family)
MIFDYHIHTSLCRHAEGEPREYVERAIALGMTEMGFADHLPFPAGWAPSHEVTDDWSMDLSELDDYVSMVHDLAREYSKDVRILLGIEADYIDETVDDTATLLTRYPFDYVIGSVHIVGDRFPFDHPDMIEGLADYGYDRIRLESLGLARRAADSGLFDIIGHLDHAKKFGPPPVDEDGVAAAATAALRAVAAAGMAIELNTAGWRKPVAEPYPGPVLLAEARSLGIPLVFGSDAHRPTEVGHQFERAAGAAREAGYAELLRLSADEQEAIA